MGLSMNASSSALNGAATPDVGIAAVGQLRAVSGQLAGATAMQGYVNRAGVNLGSLL